VVGRLEGKRGDRGLLESQLGKKKHKYRGEKRKNLSRGFFPKTNQVKAGVSAGTAKNRRNCSWVNFKKL